MTGEDSFNAEGYPFDVVSFDCLGTVVTAGRLIATGIGGEIAKDYRKKYF
jgi:hypothetical protein